MTTVLVGSRDRALLWRQQHPESDGQTVILANSFESVAGLTLRADAQVVHLGGLPPVVEADIDDALFFALRV